MPVEVEPISDNERWKKSVQYVGEIIGIDHKTIENYLVLAYDGTDKIKADTDIPDLEGVITVVQVFLEHVSGKKVRLED